MPVPVSVTQTLRYWPGGMSCWRAPASSIHLLAVSMVMRPPSGMASRALMQRFSSAFSSWPGSISAGHRPAKPTTSSCMAGPIVRRTRSSMSLIRRFTFTGFGSRVCLRENARRRWVKAAARLAAPCATRHVAVDLGEPALRHPRLHQLQRAGYARQQVVEVVRQPAGQLSDGLHLLRLPQSLLGFRQGLGLPFDLGHVAHGGVDQALARHGVPGQPDIAAVLVAVAVLEGELRLPARQAFRGCQGERHVVGMHEVEERPRLHLGLGPPQRLRPRRVQADEVAVEVGDAEQVRGRLPDLVALRRPGGDLPRELDLRLLARGHVLDERVEAVDATFRGSARKVADLGDAGPPVAARPVELEGDRSPARARSMNGLRAA